MQIVQETIPTRYFSITRTVKNASIYINKRQFSKRGSYMCIYKDTMSDYVPESVIGGGSTPPNTQRRSKTDHAKVTLDSELISKSISHINTNIDLSY